MQTDDDKKKISFLGKATRNYCYTDIFLMDFGRIGWIDRDDLSKIVEVSYKDKDAYQQIFKDWTQKYGIRIVNLCGVLVNTTDVEEMIDEFHEMNDTEKFEDIECMEMLLDECVNKFLYEYYKDTCANNYRF